MPCEVPSAELYTLDSSAMNNVAVSGHLNASIASQTRSGNPLQMSRVQSGPCCFLVYLLAWFHTLHISVVTMQQ